MSSFYVNGNIVKCEGSMSLLRYLRAELRLTSVKDGCSEGACGTCTVIIDGRAMKACVQRTDRLDGIIAAPASLRGAIVTSMQALVLARLLEMDIRD